MQPGRVPDYASMAFRDRVVIDDKIVIKRLAYVDHRTIQNTDYLFCPTWRELDEVWPDSSRPGTPIREQTGPAVRTDGSSGNIGISAVVAIAILSHIHTWQNHFAL